MGRSYSLESTQKLSSRFLYSRWRSSSDISLTSNRSSRGKIVFEKLLGTLAFTLIIVDCKLWMECVLSSLPSKLLLQNLRLKSVSTFSCLDSNSGKENSSRKNPRDLQAAKFFQVMVKCLCSHATVSWGLVYCLLDR